MVCHLAQVNEPELSGKVADNIMRKQFNPPRRIEEEKTHRTYKNKTSPIFKNVSNKRS